MCSFALSAKPVYLQHQALLLQALLLAYKAFKTTRCLLKNIASANIHFTASSVISRVSGQRNAENVRERRGCP